RNALHGRNAQLFANTVFDLARHFRVFAQILTHVVFTLPDARAVVAEPGAGLVDDAGLHAQIDDFAFARNAGAVHDVELCLLEGRRHLVLDDLDARFVADDFVAFLDGTDASDVETNRRIELERVTTRGGFGVAEHDADLHADLVDEDDHAVGALDGGRE